MCVYLLFLIRLLPVVGFPGAFGNRHIRKHSRESRRLPGPLELVQVDLATVGKSLGHAVGEFGVGYILRRISAGHSEKAETLSVKPVEIIHRTIYLLLATQSCIVFLDALFSSFPAFQLMSGYWTWNCLSAPETSLPPEVAKKITVLPAKP